MSTPEPLTRRHVSFAIAGLVFGAVLGFTAAHQIYVGRRAHVPVAQNAPSDAGAAAMGMRGGQGSDADGEGMLPGGAGPMAAGGGPPDMGTCLRRLGRPQDALDAFKTSVRQDPNHWKGWFNIGVVFLYDLRQYDEAEKAFEQVLVLNPGSFDMNAVREEIRRIRLAPEQEAQGSQGSPS